MSDLGGILGGASEAAAAGLRMVQALRAAQYQQQIYQDQQRQRAFENDLQLRQQGGTPFEQYGEAAGTGPSTSSVPGKRLIPRNEPQPLPGKGSVVKEPIGGK